VISYEDDIGPLVHLLIFDIQAGRAVQAVKGAFAVHGAYVVIVYILYMLYKELLIQELEQFFSEELDYVEDLR
jgi:hypothetical protein